LTPERDRLRVLFQTGDTMSDNTKIAIGLIVGAPMIYFLLVVLMSF
jgi:hypothetical protein